MKIAGDFSYHNDLNNAQWDILGKVMDGAIIRLGFGVTIDNMANTHIAQANRLGIPYAGYWWSDPTRTIPAQLEVIKRAVGIFNPASLYLDAEQYWRDWPAYMRQDLVECYRTKFTPAQLNSFYLKNYQATKSALSIPVGNYSADWFVGKYAPDMAKWIYNSPNYWEARYMRYYYDPILWAEIKKMFPVDISYIKEIAEKALIIRGGARQFESYIEVKGLTKWSGWHQDWNVFTEESFAEMFDQEVEAPEPVTATKYKVITYALYIRDVPNGKIIGFKWYGQIVRVREIVNGWGYLTTGGWMSINEKYVREVTWR